MRLLVGGALAFLVVLFACDSAREPLTPSQRSRPRFSHTGTPALETSTTRDCALGNAYLGDQGHLTGSPSATFRVNGVAVNQCGNRSFADDPLSFDLTYQKLSGEPDSTVWQKRIRHSLDGAALDSLVQKDYAAAGAPRTAQVSAVLYQAYDGISWEANFSATGEVRPFNEDSELWVKVWKYIQPPSNASASASGNVVTLSWTNTHQNRGIDGTVVQRYNAVTNALARTVILAHDASSFVDTVPDGSWRYEVRHGQEDILPNDVFAGMLGDPVQVNIGSVAPTNLFCYGHFAAVIDCSWQNAVQTLSVQVLRDGAVVATLPAGTNSFSDSGVTRNVTYVYRVRHVDNGFPGLQSNPDTVVAAPEPPVLLSCGDISDTSIRCHWDGYEPTAETEVHRSTTGVRFDLLATKAPGITSHLDEGLTTGTTYWYKVRFKLGGEFSDWSNTLAQDAGGIGPERLP